jgi:hypothetical protein
VVYVAGSYDQKFSDMTFFNGADSLVKKAVSEKHLVEQLLCLIINC